MPCLLQMADVVENEAKMAYMKPSGTAAANTEEHRGPSKGFVVREAPWATNNEKVNLKHFTPLFDCLFFCFFF